ncbi:hypothetical protein B484DRAFT_468223 [Ochromonadaceae sp. CCMP2298]|nr:hypothetical protein B484DRAFT_468223 [Ochromonadaceae sp. CCMP2298]
MPRFSAIFWWVLLTAMHCRASSGISRARPNSSLHAEAAPNAKSHSALESSSQPTLLAPFRDANRLVPLENQPPPPATAAPLLPAQSSGYTTTALEPTAEPTAALTAPTAIPTAVSTAQFTAPSEEPSAAPSPAPTASPTFFLVLTHQPTSNSSDNVKTPTAAPTPSSGSLIGAGAALGSPATARRLIPIYCISLILFVVATATYVILVCGCGRACWGYIVHCGSNPVIASKRKNLKRLDSLAELREHMEARDLSEMGVEMA